VKYLYSRKRHTQELHEAHCHEFGVFLFCNHIAAEYLRGWLLVGLSRKYSAAVWKAFEQANNLLHKARRLRLGDVVYPGETQKLGQLCEKNEK